MAQKSEKDFLVFYKSSEHYEILGFVRAKSAKEALKKAKRELKGEAERYEVKRAMLFEISGGLEIGFG